MNSYQAALPQQASGTVNGPGSAESSLAQLTGLALGAIPEIEVHSVELGEAHGRQVSAASPGRGTMLVIRLRAMAVVQRITLLLLEVSFRLIFRIRLNGVENIPNPPERIIIVANHFCSLDSMLLGALLPFQPVFLMAAESDRHRFMHLLSKIFAPITIRRGSSDRQGIQRAVEAITGGAALAMFPEGVVNPETALLVDRGAPNDSRRRELVRPCAMLINARPGAAYLAAKSEARILPIGLYGTQDLMKRFKQLRRVSVQLNIGVPIGPFSVDPTLKGRERRNAVEVISRTIMEQIAAQLPPGARGQYTAASGSDD